MIKEYDLTMQNSASYFNQVRHHVFSTYNKYGAEKAYDCLYGYKPHMLYPTWIGLKAELDFYIHHKDEYTLDISADCGNKCDFIGNIEGLNGCRIDVTTNLDFKKLEDYEPIQKKDQRMYKIVIMDKDNGEIKDIVDLNFAFSKSGGRLMDIALFMPQDYNSHGEPRNNPWQRILTVDTYDPATFNKEVDMVTDWYLPDIRTELDGLYEAEIPEPESQLQSYLIDAAKLLSKTTGRNIVACGQLVGRFNSVTEEDDYFTQLYWRHPVVENYLDEVIYDEI